MVYNSEKYIRSGRKGAYKYKLRRTAAGGPPRRRRRCKYGRLKASRRVAGVRRVCKRRRRVGVAPRRRRRRCKYGKLKSPYQDDEGVKRVCKRKRRRRGGRRRVPKGQDSLEDYGVTGPPFAVPW